MKPAYASTLFENDYTNIEFVKTPKHVILKMKEKKPCLILLNQKKDNICSRLILDKIKEESLNTQVIIITEQPDVDKAVACIKQGAYDYLVTPIDKQRFISSVSNAIEKWQPKKRSRFFRKKSEQTTLKTQSSFHLLSPEMKK